MSYIEEPISDFTEAQRSVRRFARGMSSSRNAILVISSDHKIVWFDSEFAALSGYSLHRLRSQNLDILFPSKYLKERHPKLFAEFLKKSRSAGFKAKSMYADRDIELLGQEKVFFAKITIHYFQHEESEEEFGIAVLLPKASDAPVTINNNYGETKIGLLFDFANLASAKWRQLLTLAAILLIFVSIYGLFEVYGVIHDVLPPIIKKYFKD